MLWPWASYPNSCKLDLSNEILNIDFGLGAAKIPEVKVGVRKKYLPNGPVRTHVPGSAALADIFSELQTLTSGIFAAP